LYKPDYKVLGRNGVEYYAEAKGFEDEKWRIKRRLYEHYGPAPLQIWVRQGKKGIVLRETIVPKGEGNEIEEGFLGLCEAIRKRGQKTEEQR
jgi:hypothetical protein